MFTPSDDERQRSRSPPQPRHANAPEQHVHGDEGRAVSPAAAFNATSHPDWASLLMHLVRLERSRLGKQARALKIHSGFAGMSSHARVLAELQIQYREIAAAEPKPAAKQFVRDNHLLAEHHFNDVQCMIDGGWCCVCMQRCVLEPERPDSYTGGFSCQPFSQMRSGRQSRTRVPPEQHPLFKNAVLQVKYLRKVQPRIALLENTSGIAHESSYGGTVMSGIDWLREQLQDLYHIEFVDVDLLPWLFMRRRRCWIFCIHVDVGSAEVAREACRLTTVIQQRRALHPPAHIAEFMFAPESPEWLSQVRSGLAGSLAPVGGEVVDAAWHRQVTEQRERWHQSGFNGHDSHPLVHAALRGLSTRPRERAVLEVHLIQACWDMGGSPKNPEDIALAKKVLVRDCSQNVRGIQGAACTKRDLHGNTTSLACSSICTSARLYSYQWDRKILPEEILRALGWQTPRYSVNCHSIATHDLQDLVGECQALPNLGAAIMALILSCGKCMPGLWAE